MAHELTTLYTLATKTRRHGNSYRFYFHADQLLPSALVQSLVDAGSSIKVYAGSFIWSAQDGEWGAARKSKVTRDYCTLEVALG